MFANITTMMTLSISNVRNVISIAVVAIIMAALIVQQTDYNQPKLASVQQIQFHTLTLLGVQVIFYIILIACTVAVVTGIFSDDLSTILYKFEYPLLFNFPHKVDI